MVARIISRYWKLHQILLCLSSDQCPMWTTENDWDSQNLAQVNFHAEQTFISSFHIYENSKQRQHHQIFAKTFSLFGYPAKITTDYGPQFKSSDFKAYLSTHNKEHCMVTPYWPIASGEVERFNRTLGKAIKCAHVQWKNWTDELEKLLLRYRSTTHSVTQFMPSDIMFSHKFNTDIPTFQEKEKKNHHKTLD